jgi:hypothetical protein
VNGLRNLTIGYIVFLVLVMTVWLSILPTQEEVIMRLAEGRMSSVVNAMETQITSRYLTVDMEGNVTHTVYTYYNANITDWELMPNRTSMILYFNVSTYHRVKRYGTLIDEYPGDSNIMSALARLTENEIWELDVESIKEVEEYSTSG